MRAAFGAWLSPVERTVRVREVPSSNLGAPTMRQTPPNLGGVCSVCDWLAGAGVGTLGSVGTG